MSETESITTRPKSDLSDLRRFRLNKNCLTKAEPSSSTCSSSSSSMAVAVPGKKRIKLMIDSDDSEHEISSKRFEMDLSPSVQEARIDNLKKMFPSCSTMEVQDALLHNNWDLQAAERLLKEKYPKPEPEKAETSVKSITNGYKRSTTETSRKASKSSSQADYGDPGDDDVHDEMSQVYDSEDSDTEASFVMTGQRKEVLEFMNTAGQLELQTVKTLSEKKAAMILEIRPFKDWHDLCKKLKKNKNLAPELLNFTQELILKQQTVAQILTGCNDIISRLEAAIATGAGIVDQPSILNNDMKLADYQMIGLNWLVVMHNQKMNSILADEMGLGKTIQIIAFLAYLKQHNLANGAHLIVVPSSTLDNWENEIKHWCPTLVIEKYHGNQEERKRMRVRFAKEGFTGFDVLLTTYHVVSSTPEERKMFRVCRLHYVVFDEAHLLKNMTTQRYANLITINAERRILLTGTPLQNNLLELMSLLCFVMPKRYAAHIDKIKSLFAKRVKSENANDSPHFTHFAEQQVENAKRIMKPFVLRRLKKDVLSNLPAKFTHVTKIPMTETQKKYYNECVEYYSNNKGEVCSGERAGVAIMMEMRKIANHPLLMRYYITDEKLHKIAKRLASIPLYKKTNAEYIFEDLAIMSDFQIWQLCQKNELYDVRIPNELICDSGKFRHLDVLLPKLKEEGHRVLLFSQFTMVLDIVERYLEIRKFGYCRLDGSTAVDERQDLINDFNQDSDIFIFLLSTKAGGVGINLTAADTCIIHDIDFNPYNDKQAEDRCHRMGQKRAVNIYRLVSEGTIEEGILMVAEEKLKLERNISSTEKGEHQEKKCVLRLLTMALGLDEDEKERLNNSLNSSNN